MAREIRPTTRVRRPSENHTPQKARDNVTGLASVVGQATCGWAARGGNQIIFSPEGLILRATMKQGTNLLLSTMVVLLCLTSACVPTQGGIMEAPVSTYLPNNEWQSTTPEEQGLDSALILQMFQEIQDRKLDIHSFLLVRNGYQSLKPILTPTPKI
jgi:hypothetical protein